MRALFPDDESFDTPKPTRLVERMLRLATRCKDSDIVLDFFAGSGTTAHAVLGLNQQEHGNRRFVLAQLPEATGRENFPTIADICKERLRRTVLKVSDVPSKAHGHGVGEGQDLGFRVFKLDSSNIRAWAPDPDDLEGALLDSIEHIRAGRMEQDVLYELLLKVGLDLCVPIEERSIAGKPVHSVGAGTLLVCLAKTIVAGEVEELALGIASWHGG